MDQTGSKYLQQQKKVHHHSPFAPPFFISSQRRQKVGTKMLLVVSAQTYTRKYGMRVETCLHNTKYVWCYGEMQPQGLAS